MFFDDAEARLRPSPFAGRARRPPALLLLPRAARRMNGWRAHAAGHRAFRARDAGRARARRRPVRLRRSGAGSNRSCARPASRRRRSSRSISTFVVGAGEDPVADAVALFQRGSARSRVCSPALDPEARTAGASRRDRRDRRGAGSRTAGSSSAPPPGSSSCRVRLIGLPTDSHTSFLRGAAAGPAAIRAALASDHGNRPAENGLELGADIIVEDIGDLPLRRG